MNKLIIIGNLVRDPELRRTQNGTPVTSFSLAVDRDFKSQGGEKETARKLFQVHIYYINVWSELFALNQ